MNCPNCNLKMEYENAPIAKMFIGLDNGSVMTHQEGHTLANAGGERSTAGAHYYCDSCDSEWVWYRSRRHKPRFRMIDGGDRALEAATGFFHP